eukprot:3610022-Alexandrium_andersonii.AAC.1
MTRLTRIYCHSSGTSPECPMMLLMCCPDRAPEVKAFPLDLASAQRTLAPARNASYYHRLQPHLAKARLLPFASDS